MSTGDIYVKDPGGLNSIPVQRWQVRGTTAGGTAGYAINPGEPVKVAAAGSIYALAITDGEGVIGTSVSEIGLATKAFAIAAADGFVDVQLFMPNVVYAGHAKSSTAANTTAKILALQGKRVIWDLTSGVYTVDTAAADNANNALLIVGGDPTSNTVYFLIRSNITLVGNTL